MWQCSRCRELIADSFDACWNCGTERTGAAPSAFVPEPSDASVPDPGPSPEDLYVADAEEHPVGEGGPEEHPIEHRATGRRPVRFQFSLRTLFLLNFLAACVLGGIKVLTTQKPASEFLSPCLWSLGALSIIFLAAMGDAVGRDWGAVVGSLLGLGIWVLMLWASYENQIPLYLPAQTLAMVGTLAAIVVPVLLRLRSRDASDDELPTVTRLLLGQRHRSNRKS